MSSQNHGFAVDAGESESRVESLRCSSFVDEAVVPFASVGSQSLCVRTLFLSSSTRTTKQSKESLTRRAPSSPSSSTPRQRVRQTAFFAALTKTEEDLCRLFYFHLDKTAFRTRLCCCSGGPTDTFFLFEEFFDLLRKEQVKQVARGLTIQPYRFRASERKVLLLGARRLRCQGAAVVETLGILSKSFWLCALQGAAV